MRSICSARCGPSAPARATSPSAACARSRRAIAQSLGGTAEVEYIRGYPATVNSEREAEFAAQVGERLFGVGNVVRDVDPTMGGEDFAYFLEAKPGAYVFLGQGGGPSGCSLHNPHYDFNDAVIPLGAGYLAALAEAALPTAAPRRDRKGHRIMRKSFTRLLPAAAVIGVLVVSATHAATFRFANQGDSLSVDPYMHNEAVLLSLTGNVYESLTGRGRKFETSPELATDWKQTAPTVWRFNLRKGVKFHDGSPFTADDVIFSFERARGEGSDVKVYVGAIKEIRKVDAHAIDIVTTEPFLILPQTVSRWYVMSKSWCEKNNATRPADVRKGNENYASLHANGTGPFILKSREPGVRTVFAANPDWWGKAEHNITEAVFTPISNDATRVAALISGEIDMMDPVPLQDVPRLQGERQSQGDAVAGVADHLPGHGPEARRAAVLEREGQEPVQGSCACARPSTRPSTSRRSARGSCAAFPRPRV